MLDPNKEITAANLRAFLAAYSAGSLLPQAGGPVQTITVTHALTYVPPSQLEAYEPNPWETCINCILCPITCPLMCAFNCCLVRRGVCVAASQAVALTRMLAPGMLHLLGAGRGGGRVGHVIRRAAVQAARLMTLTTQSLYRKPRPYINTVKGSPRAQAVAAGGAAAAAAAPSSCVGSLASCISCACSLSTVSGL